MYPFGDINRELHRQLADKIYNVEAAKDSGDGEISSVRTITEEAVFVGISYIMEQKSVDCSIFNFAGTICCTMVSHYKFNDVLFPIDVLGQSGEGILSASSFGFRSYMSIEV